MTLPKLDTGIADGDNTEMVEMARDDLPTVTLIVGPAQRMFSIREDLLCDKCPFFNNAFGGDFIESQTKTLNFPDDDPARFAELCKWLRTDALRTDYVDPTWLWLVKAWLFGEKYHIDQYQNEIVDALHAKFAAREEGLNISFETLDYVAENASQRSALRRMFADMLTNGISLQHLPQRVESIPHEFLQDMCIALKTTVARNAPTNTSLLTNPVSTYYSDSSSCKATAMPKVVNPPTEIYCEGEYCANKIPREPIRDNLHICTNHNLKLCEADRRLLNHHHGRKVVSLTSTPYRDAISGTSTVIDGYFNDSGFYCDGPKCDPESRKLTHRPWALMSGDRYHCLECDNLDFCTICMRGELECKKAGHPLLRIRPTHAKRVPLTEEVNIKQKQERIKRGVCWRCGIDGHWTDECEAKEAAKALDLEVEN